MNGYWWGVAAGLAVGVMFGATGAQMVIASNCEKVHLLVLDSKAFECKAAKEIGR